MADVENQEAPAVDIQGMRSSENADKNHCIQGSQDGLGSPSSGVFLRPPTRQFYCSQSESILEADERGPSRPTVVRFHQPLKQL